MPVSIVSGSEPGALVKIRLWVNFEKLTFQSKKNGLGRMVSV